MCNPTESMGFEHFTLRFFFSSDDQAIANGVLRNDVQGNLEAPDSESAPLALCVMRKTLMCSALRSLRIDDVTLRRVKVAVEECMGGFLRKEAEILTFLVMV